MSQVKRLRLKLANRRYSQHKKAVLENATSAETALRESEAFYRQMFERNHAVKLVIDPLTAQIVQANQAACDFYGYTPEQIKTLRFTDINALPESEIQATIQRITAEKGITFQTQHRLASGVIREVEVFAGLLDINDKHYLYCIVQDITSRVQAEKALRQSEKLLRLVTEHIPNTGVFMFDRDMRYTLAEGPYLKNLGSTYENLVGKTLQEALPEDAVNFLAPIYKRALQGEAFSYERVTENYTYESYIAPIRDDQGQIVGGVVLSHDITKRKEVEKALREREELYRNVTQHMPNTSIFIFDHDLRYTLVEVPYIKSFESAYENMVGKTLQEMLPADSVNFLLPIYKRALEGESFSFERMTDNYAYEAYAAPVRDDSGKIIGGMILSHDITERKRVERVLREREELHRLFTQHMPNTSVIMFGNDMRFTLVEGDFLRRIGLIPENMIGKTPQEVLSEDTLNFMLPIYERVLRGEAFAYDRTTPEYAYHAYANPLKNTTGEIIGGMFLSHDITEAKRAEEALRASETRFHSLVDLAPVGIIQTDVEGKRVFCNSRWCELTGITLEEALSDENYETIYPDDFEIASGAWETMMETHLPFDNVFFRYQRPDKTTVWVSGNGRPLYDANGEISGYIGSVTDVTEHKLLEEALTTSESRFRTLIDFAPVGIVETDAQGMVILGNAHWNMLSGISPDRAFIENGSETVHPDDLPMIQAVNQTMLDNTNPVNNLEYRFLHPDGKVVWVSDSSRPLINLDGDVTGYIYTMTDITERKRLEEALRQNEERLRGITDNIQDLVSQSDGEGRFVFASPSYQTVLGYDPQALIGTSAMELLHPEDLPILTQRMQAAIERSAQQVTFESRLRHADGHYIPVESVGKLFVDNASLFAGGVFITRDISERLRLQNLLLDKEKLQTALDKELELNNLKTRMMNRIAHEFRTPLTVIQATTETLTTYLDRLSPEQRKTKEVSIKAQIQRLTDMLDEIGQVIKTDFTPDRVHRTTTDLSALCRQIATRIERETNQPDQFVLELPETTAVLVDPQVVNNAFMQVMHNAARFSDHATPVNVSLSSAEKSITLRVVDTGIGIPPKEQPRIFEPFFRGSNIGESSGLGVGLTMTRAAVEAHGGTITVDSELGKGTTVTIWIPV